MNRTLARARAALLLVAAAACSEATAPPVTVAPPATRPVLAQDYRPTGRTAAGDVFVHLFEWRWDDVAAECERVLGPAGFRAVQVSPPQEHLVLPGAPWWQRYQPVSYRLDRSRSGTGAEFTAMVRRCRDAGVDIYVDAVINHMTAGSGTGSAGTVYEKYRYPGLYDGNHFHPPCEVRDYSSAANVQDCELLGLADLHTGLAPVRQRIVDYLMALVRLGVAGFRIDAAKHIQPVELDSIVAGLNRAAAAEGRPAPYLFSEVIDHGGEAVRASDYFGLGYSSGGASDITEFRFRGVGDKFRGLGGQRLAQLNPQGPAGSRFSEAAWGLIPSDKAVVFIENHDTQRSGGLGYPDGHAYRLAQLWMLAQPYGYPSVMSSYAFDRNTQVGRDAGPPSVNGVTRPVACADRLDAVGPGDWVCEHRDPAVLGMVVFRRAVAGAGIERWVDNGANAIAFSRGDRGWFALNRETASASIETSTGLPAGVYCDLLTGGRSGSGCAGRTVTLDAAGSTKLDLPLNTAVAIIRQSRL